MKKYIQPKMITTLQAITSVTIPVLGGIFSLVSEVSKTMETDKSASLTEMNVKYQLEPLIMTVLGTLTYIGLKKEIGEISNILFELWLASGGVPWTMTHGKTLTKKLIEKGKKINNVVNIKGIENDKLKEMTNKQKQTVLSKLKNFIKNNNKMETSMAFF